VKRLLVLGLALATFALPASAAEKKGAKDGIIDLGEITVEGKVQKPQVFYVLGRSQFRYQGLRLRRSFIGRILDSAKKNPF
jgi:hypothetical protein